MNNKGPSTLPRGTPEVNVKGEEKFHLFVHIENGSLDKRSKG